MGKYIIKNCPAYSEKQGVYWTCYEDNNKLLCQDCSDCVMKQIVKKCNEDWEDMTVDAFQKETLDLLDIQEVE